MELIIFDLDGTLTPQRPSSTAAFRRTLLPGVRDACGWLLARNRVLTIATNQGGIAQGLPAEAVEEFLRWVSGELGVAAWRYAWQPERKKPRPAMLLELLELTGYRPELALLVGDSAADAAAATAAGVRYVHGDEFFAAHRGGRGA